MGLISASPEPYIPSKDKLKEIDLDIEGVFWPINVLRKEMVKICLEIEGSGETIDELVNDKEKLNELMIKTIENPKGRERILEWGEANWPDLKETREAIQLARDNGLGVVIHTRAAEPAAQLFCGFIGAEAVAGGKFDDGVKEKIKNNEAIFIDNCDDIDPEKFLEEFGVDLSEINLVLYKKQMPFEPKRIPLKKGEEEDYHIQMPLESFKINTYPSVSDVITGITNQVKSQTNASASLDQEGPQETLDHFVQKKPKSPPDL